VAHREDRVGQRAVGATSAAGVAVSILSWAGRAEADQRGAGAAADEVLIEDVMTVLLRDVGQAGMATGAAGASVHQPVGADQVPPCSAPAAQALAHDRRRVVGLQDRPQRRAATAGLRSRRGRRGAARRWGSRNARRRRQRATRRIAHGVGLARLSAIAPKPAWSAPARRAASSSSVRTLAEQQLRTEPAAAPPGRRGARRRPALDLPSASAAASSRPRCARRGGDVGSTTASVIDDQQQRVGRQSARRHEQRGARR
jgi:hypothetical protein